jgi:hypothetical protein
MMLDGGTETLTEPFTFILGETSPAKVTIDGGGRILQSTSSNSIFLIERGVTVTLQHIVLRGMMDNSYILVVVENGGALVLGDGVFVEQNNGGVSVNTGGGLTIRNGSMISGNNIGVFVNGGEAVMSGGTVAGNKYGGVTIFDGNFTMRDGSIRNNTTFHNDPHANGGAVFVNGGAFTMLGGYLHDNVAYKGGAVFVSPYGRFTMKGGYVFGNTGFYGRGGQVYVERGGSFFKEDGGIFGEDAIVYHEEDELIEEDDDSRQFYRDNTLYDTDKYRIGTDDLNTGGNVEAGNTGVSGAFFNGRQEG